MLVSSIFDPCCLLAIQKDYIKELVTINGICVISESLSSTNSMCSYRMTCAVTSSCGASIVFTARFSTSIMRIGVSSHSFSTRNKKSGWSAAFGCSVTLIVGKC